MFEPGSGAILTAFAFFIGIGTMLFVGAAMLPNERPMKPASRAKRRQRRRRAP